MKSCEVLRLLRISRPTLSKYVKDGVVKVVELPNGRYDYDTDSVYAILNRGVPRKTCIYARVSTLKQRADLSNQISRLEQFCAAKGYAISGVYSDVASDISFDKRSGFFDLLDEVIDNQVERVVITYKDRLSRVGFDLFYHLFKKYNCEIVVMNDAGSEKLDSQEIFEDIVRLLHCYSMKFYSKRRITKIKEVLEEDEGKPTDQS